MKSNPVSSATQLSHRTMRSGRPAFLAALAVAAMFITSQALAQTLSARSTADQVQTPASDQEVQALPPAPAPSAISASVPASQEARVVNPFADPSFAFAPTPDSGQSGSNSVMAPPRAQPPHHGLAKTAAIVGTVVLGFGAGAFALAASHCSNYDKGPCNAFHTGGIVAMAAGGATAGTGFYFWFRHP